jgi:hypothetical protein
VGSTDVFFVGFDTLFYVGQFAAFVSAPPL